MTDSPFDIKALSGRATDLSKQIGTQFWQYQRQPLQNELEKTQAELGVAEQYQSDVMSGNRAANDRLNTGALASSRRKAGGGTFRRPRSSVTANDLAPNLGRANAKSLAETRRAKALADVAVRQGQQQTGASGFSIGPAIRLW